MIESSEASQTSAPIPLLSISGRSPLRTDPIALVAYYADRRLMWRNVIFIGLANMGWGMAFTIIGPLMGWKLLDLGIGENIPASMTSVNTYASAFLVILFSWMSDHTISRMGRRKPYFFISAPVIILTITFFPFFAVPKFIALLMTMQVFYLLAMDLKASTFSLINIDCVPREMLGRTSAVFGIVGGLVGFVLNQKAGVLIRLGEWVPYVLGGGVMTLTTLFACLVKEPPVYNPPTEPLRPWSTFKVAAVDKRIFVLMAGIAMVGGFGAISGQFLGLWAKGGLGLDREEIYNAISWTCLINVGLSYPMGWVIDRFGGLKVVAGFFLAEVICFILTFYVHDRSSLTTLILAQTIGFPLYQAADIVLFKCSSHKDIGSITSSNAFIRNFWNATMLGSVGWIIYWSGHNYHVGFTIGFIVWAIGMTLFFIYYLLMKMGGRVLPDEEHPGLPSRAVVLAGAASAGAMIRSARPAQPPSPSLYLWSHPDEALDHPGACHPHGRAPRRRPCSHDGRTLGHYAGALAPGRSVPER